ncbi:hypothetical protein [Corynebacterium sp. HMSC078H07]|uniref:hypothetical protein n=1 Tax=Corynebacterium sp. HMSC078H07 TaxID=1739379 RepID=UPI001FEE3833|nr:hypothetical protein [Corynebacterium sp. HMSC078H07]
MKTHPAVVKIRTRNGYCSGVLVDSSLEPQTQHRAELVLTCAHFFRDGLEEGDMYKVSGGFNRRLKAVRTIDGTDMALCALDSPAPARDVPGIAAQTPSFRDPVFTWGFGARPVAHSCVKGSFSCPSSEYGLSISARQSLPPAWFLTHCRR